MNKLVLIGNGFDLAHGLPTLYEDFLNDFWKNLKSNYKEHLIKEIVFVNELYDGFFDFSTKAQSFGDFWNNIKDYRKERKFYINETNYELKKEIGNFDTIFKFKNNFFRTINTKSNIEGWVDIENEYYKELKEIIRLKSKNMKNEEVLEFKKKELLVLNKEFDQVKELLKGYLVFQVNGKYDFSSTSTPLEYSILLEALQANNFFQNTIGYQTQLKKYSNEFSYSEDRGKIDSFIQDLTINSQRTITFKTLLVDFNYTSTVNFYIRKLKDFIYEYSVLKIHGDLNHPVFGYGDETDEEYRKIENLNDNEYLKNFKSFYYSNDNSYDTLLQYIDSAKFQVWIMGHSCGLSDRVMLNTIFEHENCRSIKLFYYEKEGKDNYQDLVMNISRHFKDKALMRRKVVDKTLCSPLPQGVRFKKKES